MIRTPRLPLIDIYRDAAGQWRWRLRAGNGRIIADGSEGYSERRHAERAMYAAKLAMAPAQVRYR